MVYAYLADPSRVTRFADRLEEDVVHHASILQQCNINNTNLAVDVYTNTPSMPSTIAGQMYALPRAISRNRDVSAKVLSTRKIHVFHFHKII